MAIKFGGAGSCNSTSVRPQVKGTFDDEREEVRQDADSWQIWRGVACGVAINKLRAGSAAFHRSAPGTAVCA